MADADGPSPSAVLLFADPANLPDAKIFAKLVNDLLRVGTLIDPRNRYQVEVPLQRPVNRQGVSVPPGNDRKPRVQRRRIHRSV